MEIQELKYEPSQLLFNAKLAKQFTKLEPNAELPPNLWCQMVALTNIKQVALAGINAMALTLPAYYDPLEIQSIFVAAGYKVTLGKERRMLIQWGRLPESVNDMLYPPQKDVNEYFG